MGRDTGPVERLSRREGVDLELKGDRRARRKGGLDRRGDRAPGQHGERRRKISLYAQQLRAKQRAKRYYGVRERQFRRIVDDGAKDLRAGTGAGFAALLERRLDNILVRAGFATTRPQARQFVVHGHVHVDGKRVDIPSFRVGVGNVVTFAPTAPVRPLATEATERVALVPDWLTVDPRDLRVTVARLPHRVDIQAPIDDQLIVEFYNRG